MAKKGVPGKGRKKDDRQWQRIGAIAVVLLIIVVMIISVFYSVFTGRLPTSGTSNSTYTIEKRFNSISDGLTALPSGALYTRYVDLTASDPIANWSREKLGGGIPNTTRFGKPALKDEVAIFPYPEFGFFRQYGDYQVVSLTDFGPHFDNASYTRNDYQGYPMRAITSSYGFSLDTYPVIHGAPQCVAAVESFLASGTTNSSYYDYADLFDQIATYPETADDARFAVVGTTDTTSFGGDRYFAGITAAVNNSSNYKIVYHLGVPLNDSQKQHYTYLWETTARQYFNYSVYSATFKGDYLIVNAYAPPEVCLNDLLNNWPSLLQG